MPYTDFHYTPTGTGVISGKEVLEQTEDAINDLGGQISGDVQTAIDTANNALNVANTASSDAQNAVNTANTAYTTATNAQNTANAAQNTASNALTAAQNAQNDVNALGNRVTTAENNITQNTSDISGLTTRMGTAEGNITTLQNDVITAQGTATSAQNTATMARQQAYVLRYSSTAITDNSTIAYSTLDNTDNIKADDKIIDVDGKIFSVVSVDSDNSTVTVGSALIDLALDANVMHLSGNETKSGELTLLDTLNSSDIVPRSNNTYDFGSVSKFLKNLYAYHAFLRGQQQGDEYSPNARTNLTLLANRDTLGISGIFFDTFRENTAQGTGSHILGVSMKENSIRYEGCRFTWLYDDDNNGYGFSLRPTMQGTNQPIKYELGNSISKWDTINGINPGALSLPDTSNSIDISGYITNLTGSANTYTALADGYVSIRITGTAMRIAVSNGVESSSQRSSAGAVACYVPVVAGETVSVYAVGTSINNAIFRPCKGNV